MNDSSWSCPISLWTSAPGKKALAALDQLSVQALAYDVVHSCWSCCSVLFGCSGTCASEAATRITSRHNA